MGSTAQARYVIRGVFVGIAALVAAAGTIWVDNPYVKIASAAVAASAIYFGVGYVSPAVEPFVGARKADPNKSVVPNKL